MWNFPRIWRKKCEEVYDSIHVVSVQILTIFFPFISRVALKIQKACQHKLILLLVHNDDCGDYAESKVCQDQNVAVQDDRNIGEGYSYFEKSFLC